MVTWTKLLRCANTVLERKEENDSGRQKTKGRNGGQNFSDFEEGGRQKITRKKIYDIFWRIRRLVAEKVKQS